MYEQDANGTACQVEVAGGISTTLRKQTQGVGLADDLLATSVGHYGGSSHQPSRPFRLRIDYKRPLEKMIAEGGYAWTNPDISARTYPCIRAGTAEMEVELVHLDHFVEKQTILKELGERNLRAATLHELLSCDTICREMQPNSPIVALGSSWLHPCGGHRVPFLWTGHTGRRLDLYWLEDRWEKDFQFLGVRK